jgi:hypothetical protein
MPGWTAGIPLQRLLVEYADMFPNRSDVQIAGATDLVKQMEEVNAGFLTQNPALKVRTDSLRPPARIICCTSICISTGSLYSMLMWHAISVRRK